MLWVPISRPSLRKRKKQDGHQCRARPWLSYPAPPGQGEVSTLGSVSSHLYSSPCWLRGSSFQPTGIPQAHVCASSFSLVCMHTSAQTHTKTLELTLVYAGHPHLELWVLPKTPILWGLVLYPGQMGARVEAYNLMVHLQVPSEVSS